MPAPQDPRVLQACIRTALSGAAKMSPLCSVRVRVGFFEVDGTGALGAVDDGGAADCGNAIGADVDCGQPRASLRSGLFGLGTRTSLGVCGFGVLKKDVISCCFALG